MPRIIAVATGRVVLWLNAVGSGSDDRRGDLAPIRACRSTAAKLVPIDQLGALLVTPDAHLITLSDAFVGFVLPSKVHGCIASRKPIVFIGSETVRRAPPVLGKRMRL